MSFPLRLVPLVGGMAVLAAPLPGHGAGVTALLRALGAAARFETPVAASGTLSYETGDGTETTETFTLFARGATVRVEFGDVRALVRHGKALVARSDTTGRIDPSATLGRSNVRLGDLGVFAPSMLAVPQIVDEGLSGTVVASDPRGASPYALLVYTIDPDRALITHVKYYQWSVNNLVKRERRTDFVEVAGALRPQHISVYDVQGSGASELVLAWRAAPELPARAFRPAGLDEPLTP